MQLDSSSNPPSRYTEIRNKLQKYFLSYLAMIHKNLTFVLQLLNVLPIVTLKTPQECQCMPKHSTGMAAWVSISIFFYSKISFKKTIKQTVSTHLCISVISSQNLLKLDVVGVLSDPTAFKMREFLFLRLRFCALCMILNCLGKDVTQLLHFHWMPNLFKHLIELPVHPSAWSSTCLYVRIVLL